MITRSQCTSTVKKGLPEMSQDGTGPGHVCWFDLTVDDAEQLKDFYAKVVGWQPAPLDMGGYNDFNMQTSDGTAVTGICHARGTNSNIPPQWLIYITVDDVAESARQCQALGGEIVDGPREMGGKMCCIIRDPSGAVCALYG